MSDYILEKLYEENKNNNLVIFIGSGISKYYSDPPKKFPDWKTITDELKKGLNIDFSKNEDYLRIAQIFKDKYNRNELISVLNKLFPEDVKPGELHKLLFEIRPAHIITTNYDNLIEKALGKSYKKPQYQVLKKDRDFPYTLKHSNFIVKAHGDLKQGNIVLTERDYLNYHKNFPLFLSFLRYVFAKYRVLFVGFSLTDPNFIKILEDVKDVLGDNSIKHVAIMHEPISEEEKLYFDKKSIIIVPKNEIEEFLNLKEKDNTKYLIEYFKFLQAGYTSTRPLNIFQLLERILNIDFLSSFNFIYKDILKDVWNEQGINVIDDNLWKIGSIEITGANSSLYKILKQISNKEDIDCAMVQLLKESNIKSDENNINKLKELVIDVLSLLLKSNIVSVNEYYVTDIIQKLRKSKKKIKEQSEKEAKESKKEESEDIKMDDNSVDVDIKDYTDSSIKIDGTLWKEIFDEDDFFAKYLVGKVEEALNDLLKEIRRENLSDGEGFLELYRIRHLCRISGYREKTCFSVTKEMKNILENCDKITQSIISYFDEERYISAFQEFVDKENFFLEDVLNKNYLKDEIYFEYSSFLKFIILNKLPVLHYSNVKYLIKYVVNYFFKEVYSRQNKGVLDIPEWIIIGMMFLNLNDVKKMINDFSKKSKLSEFKLSDKTKRYTREILNNILKKELGFYNNYRIIYPENLILFLLLLSCEEEDIELFIKFWDKYIVAVFFDKKVSYDIFIIIKNLIKNIKNEESVNQYLSQYISKYKILDKYIEAFYRNNQIRENYMGHLVENLEILSLRNLKISCDTNRVDNLEKIFERNDMNLEIKKFIIYLFSICGVDKNKISEILNKHVGLDYFNKIENRFGLMEYLRTIYNFKKILKIDVKDIDLDLMLEKIVETLEHEVGSYEIHTKINAMDLLVHLILNEKISKDFIDKIEGIIENYLNIYKTPSDFKSLLFEGSNFWNNFSILCLFFGAKNENNKLSEKIKKFFEDFWSEEKIKFIVSTIKDSIYKKEMLKLLREILCKVDKKQVFKERSWLLDLICEEK